MTAMETLAEPAADLDTEPAAVSSVVDVRHIPLGRLPAAGGDALRRIVPPADSARVPVAAFGASL
jgi:hypothetical protein